MKILFFCMMIIFSSALAESSENELHIGKFSNNDLSGWNTQSIGMLKPKTIYALARDNDRTVLVSHSIKSASGLIYKLSFDPKEFPLLKWSWKIAHTIKKGDEQLKSGDDFAVRIYVLFPRGFFSKTRAICYVWANKLKKGGHVVSPFSNNIVSVAEDSGEELAGKWTFHQRNIYDDYKVFFGEEPPKAGAIAIMTDSDNTGESATGYYGDIFISRSLKAEEIKQKEQKTKDLPQKELKPKERPGNSNGNGSQLPPPMVDEPKNWGPEFIELPQKKPKPEKEQPGSDAPSVPQTVPSLNK